MTDIRDLGRAALAAGGLLLAATMPAGAGTAERVSVSSDGEQGNGDSGENGVAISADGRFVAFDSFATNLIPSDTNDTADVFVRNLKTGRTKRVSPGNISHGGQSGSPAISADGRFVTFWCEGTSLGTNGQRHICVHDRRTGKTELASVGSGGVEGNSSSDKAAISAGGRFVAFSSAASNLVPHDTNDAWDVFVRDRKLGRTERVSVGPHGRQGNGDSNPYGSPPSISADGRFVAFWSRADNLVPGVGPYQVFVHDRQAHRTELVSVGLHGAQPDDASFAPKLSADGRFVAFWSSATNLVHGDTNGVRDFFVRDRQTGKIERISVGSRGVQGNGDSGLDDTLALSADGRCVVFESVATNLVPGDTNGHADLFLRDRQTGTTERVSVGTGGIQANDDSGHYSVAIAPDCTVAFDSFATNLVRHDTNGADDVFVRAR